MVIELLFQLQTHRRFASTLLPKDQRGRWVVGIPIDFVPSGMKSANNAVVFEHCIRLCVLLRERISLQFVMRKKLLNIHHFTITTKIKEPRAALFRRHYQHKRYNLYATLLSQYVQ